MLPNSDYLGIDTEDYEDEYDLQYELYIDQTQRYQSDKHYEYYQDDEDYTGDSQEEQV